MVANSSELGKRRRYYSASEKRDIVNLALATSQASASKHFGINKSMICRWIQDRNKIQYFASASPGIKRISSSASSSTKGRRPSFESLSSDDEDSGDVSISSSGDSDLDLPSTASGSSTSSATTLSSQENEFSTAELPCNEDPTFAGLPLLLADSYSDESRTEQSDHSNSVYSTSSPTTATRESESEITFVAPITVPCSADRYSSSSVTCKTKRPTRDPRNKRAKKAVVKVSTRASKRVLAKVAPCYSDRNSEAQHHDGLAALLAAAQYLARENAEDAVSDVYPPRGFVIRIPVPCASV